MFLGIFFLGSWIGSRDIAGCLAGEVCRNMKESKQTALYVCSPVTTRIRDDS